MSENRSKAARNWTTPAELRAQVQKLWERGVLLSCLADPAPAFPRRLSLKGPSSVELSERFGEVRAWIEELRQMSYCRIELRELRHRVLGQNAVPVAAWLDSADDALAWLGKRREAERFRTLLDHTRQRQPPLLEWLARRPLRALELAADWSRLLDIVAWLQANPRPGVYLRQVDLPGVHSKFIESHRGVLTEWLDRLLPVEAINPAATGVGQFAIRYGFRDKPLRVRFRILDPRRALLATGGEQDMTLDSASFARLEPRIGRVFITENEVNYLALPPLADSMALFGAGYGFDVLAQAAWLSRCRVYYWGDIDTHGFAILDQLRAQLGQVQSLLMDRATLLAFEAQWGREEKPTRRDLTRLTAPEQALYDDLRACRLSPGPIRLEQEKIGFGWVQRALQRLVVGC